MIDSYSHKSNAGNPFRIAKRETYKQTKISR